MKVKHIYTVVREFEIDRSEKEEEIEFFKGAMTDEAGEYLYGGSSTHETITIKMEINGKPVS